MKVSKCYICVSAVWQAAGHQGGDPGPAGGTHQGAPGAGADSDGAHQGTQTQVCPVVGRVHPS